MRTLPLLLAIAGALPAQAAKVQQIYAGCRTGTAAMLISGAAQLGKRLTIMVSPIWQRPGWWAWIAFGAVDPKLPFLGCSLRVWPLVIHPMPFWSVVVPNDASLIGVRVYVQALVQIPRRCCPSSPFVDLSNAFRFQVGR